VSEVSGKAGTTQQQGSQPRKRIIVVDDEPALAELLAEMTHEIGFEADSFTAPSQALHAFAQNPNMYSVAICDQTMPEISGLELIEQMRRLNPSLGVILCSGYTRRATEQSGELDPTIRFLNKPYTFEMLREALLSLTST